MSPGNLRHPRLCAVGSPLRKARRKEGRKRGAEQRNVNESLSSHSPAPARGAAHAPVPAAPEPSPPGSGCKSGAGVRLSSPLTAQPLRVPAFSKVTHGCAAPCRFTVHTGTSPCCLPRFAVVVPRVPHLEWALSRGGCVMLPFDCRASQLGGSKGLLTLTVPVCFPCKRSEGGKSSCLGRVFERIGEDTALRHGFRG